MSLKTIKEEIQNKIYEKLYTEYLKLIEKHKKTPEPPKKQSKEKELNRLELSCEEVSRIYGKVYYVIGPKYIEKVRKKERKLRYPPIYFRSGECKELLDKMGIHGDGIYIVENGKLISKVDDPR